jgi:hypothetical protein
MSLMSSGSALTMRETLLRVGHARRGMPCTARTHVIAIGAQSPASRNGNSRKRPISTPAPRTLHPDKAPDAESRGAQEPGAQP